MQYSVQSHLYLSENLKTILKIEKEVYVDTALYLKNGTSLDEIINKLNEEENGVTTTAVQGFEYSLSKLHGLYPISKNFKIEDFIGSNIEEKEIVKSLNKK